MVSLEILGTVSGHTTMHIEDVEPDKRAELATTVQQLLKQGHAIFLVQGEESRRVVGYDDKGNDWLILAQPHEPPPTATEEADTAESKKRGRGRPRTRVSAAGTEATAVAPVAGG